MANQESRQWRALLAAQSAMVCLGEGDQPTKDRQENIMLPDYLIRVQQLKLKVGDGGDVDYAWLKQKKSKGAPLDGNYLWESDWVPARRGKPMSSKVSEILSKSCSVFGKRTCLSHSPWPMAAEHLW